MELPEHTPEELNRINRGTLMESLGIEYLEFKEGYVKARMPVDSRTIQPVANILHGGASLALAETIGSLGSLLMVDTRYFDVRGAQLSANHVRAATEGFVTGEAQIIYRGNNTHVWNIDIHNEAGELVSTARLTNFIIPKLKPKS